MIHEVIVCTRDASGSPHLAPMGLHASGDDVVLAPFRPSATLDNLQREGCAVINYCDDVRVFAGCLTGRRDWPVVAASAVASFRLRDALAHAELRVREIEHDETRPRFVCAVAHRQTHAAFAGFNRAQAAVIEAAILVSRLHMLPAEKIDREIDYLRIAIEKTAGPRERQAWDWLIERVEQHRSGAEAVQ